MNLKHSLLSFLFITASTLVSFSQNPMDNPMTQTLMKTYDQLLEEDPHDADVLFRRANIYYKCGDYLRALDDINMGFKYAESNPELELNGKVQAQWEYFKTEQHKRRRAYKKSIL